MIGLPTGACSGLYVVDIDVDEKVDGMSAYRAMELPRAAIAVRTPSGGGHAYFRWPGPGWRNTVGRIAPGIDTRGEGGYVIVPPSAAAAGGYWWVSEPMGERLLAGEVPELPEKLRALLEEAEPRERQPGGTPGGRAWAAAALRDEVAGVAAAPPGSRNDRLNRAAFSLGQIVGEGHLDRGRVEGELLAAATAAGLDDREAAATIRSGLESGLKQPRGPRGDTPASAAPDEAAFPEPNTSLLELRADPPPAFPGADVFGAVWGNWIADAAKGGSAPPDYVGLALLAAAGSLVGNARWVSPWLGWSEPPVIWGKIIGSPSAGKSPALKAVTAPLRALERRVRREAELAHAAWVEKAKAAEVYQKEWEKAVEIAAKAERTPPPRPPEAIPPEEPHIPRLTVNDVTTEALGAMLGRQPRGTLMVRDELAGFLGDMNRYNNGSGDRPFWLEAYGGGSFSVERLSRGPVSIERLTIGVIGGIQPDRLSALLMKARDDDGMLARFCPVFPLPAEVGVPTHVPDNAMVEAAFTRLYGLEMVTDASEELVPVVVRFDDAARSAMRDYYVWVRKAEGECTGLISSFMGKTPGMIARIALVLDLMEWAVGPEPVPPSRITLSTFQRAHRYVRGYLLPMARRAYAEASTSSEERAARTLAQVLKAQRIQTTTKSDVRSLRLEGLRDTRAIVAALDLLKDANILSERKIPTGGHPRTEYLVNPGIWR